MNTYTTTNVYISLIIGISIFNIASIIYAITIVIYDNTVGILDIIHIAILNINTPICHIIISPMICILYV